VARFLPRGKLMTHSTATQGTIDIPPFRSFQDDLKAHFVNVFTTGGYSFPRDAEAWDLAVLYAAMKQRSISPRPRTVYWSPELKSKLAILDDVIAHALKTIETESLTGMDLNQRMSRDVEDVECHDNLFNDLGILHLHLGVRKPNPMEFVVRSGKLLFVMVREHDIYFLDLLDHDVFKYSSPALLEIVHRNWPELIAEYRCDDVFVPLEHRPALQEKRRSGFAIPTTMSDGTVYMQPGGGMGLSEIKRGKRGRINFVAVRQANNLFRSAYQIHKWCGENATNLMRQIHRHAGVALTSLRTLHLRLDDANELFLEESVSRFQFHWK
jgi:hypothetical protein